MSSTVGGSVSPNALTRVRRSGVGPYLFIGAIAVLMLWLLGPKQFVNALTIGAIYALIALGYTMVYGIIELINFAHGDVFMVGGFVSLFILSEVLGQENPSTSLAEIGLILAVSFSSTMLIVGLLGIAIERFAYRPLRNAPRLAPLITAIGISFILQNAVQIVYGPSPVNTPQIIAPNARIDIAGTSIGWINIFIVATSVLLMVILQLFVQRTRIGRAMRSTASDREAAALMGVDINRTIAVTFFVGSALAGAAGVVQGLYFGNIQFTLGFQSGLKAFTAAVLGGIGNLAGAAIGGFFIGFVEVTAANYGLFVWAQALVFGVLIVTLVFRPAGIFGQQLGERA